METPILKKPDWIKVRVPSGDTWKHVAEVLGKNRLRTVCDEAHCPNKGECWGMGTATFMIMGDICTRTCRFCAVTCAGTGRPLEASEGIGIARAVTELGLRYVVLTSVDRDDLPDRGAGHFAACIRTIKEQNPGVKVEALIPDYTAEELPVILETKPDVVAHNVETVRSLQWVRDPRASFDKSLAALRAIKTLASADSGAVVSKTSFILGFGEQEEELFAAMDEVRAAGADILVMGQYLQPTRAELPVVEYLSPERFRYYEEEARKRGFSAVVASPLARTSYHAMDAAGG
ncbi:lipoyl synthase [Spirochaetia bacterium]|nr:lipoyl synthase [Spirochaetia bacterium]